MVVGGETPTRLLLQPRTPKQGVFLKSNSYEQEKKEPKLGQPQPERQRKHKSCFQFEKRFGDSKCQSGTIEDTH